MSRVIILLLFILPISQQLRSDILLDNGLVITDGYIESITEPNDENDQRRKMAVEMANQLQAFADSPAYTPEEFEVFSSQFIDLVNEQYDFLSAGVMLHKAFNILLDYYRSPDFGRSHLEYLATSAAEFYLMAGGHYILERLSTLDSWLLRTSQPL